VSRSRDLNNEVFAYLQALRDDPTLWSPGVDTPRRHRRSLPARPRRCVVCGSRLDGGTPVRLFCSEACRRPAAESVYVEPAEADRSWVVQASCLGCDPELFYPGRGESCREAKAVCAGCPVRVECLEYALETGEKLGIWGGASERERRRLRARRRNLAGAA
jgi:WhiB family redox-sensing transcriptional regulator